MHSVDDILIGVGANLESERWGPPRVACEAALLALAQRGIKVRRRSRWFRSAPVPLSDQPWYVNGVALVDTLLPPEALLGELHAVERLFGRERRIRNETRVIDLDLLAYDELVRQGPGPPILPHPRLSERAFVLLPLSDLLPHWRHPADGRKLSALIASLPPDQIARPLAGEPPAG